MSLIHSFEVELAWTSELDGQLVSSWYNSRISVSCNPPRRQVVVVVVSQGGRHAAGDRRMPSYRAFVGGAPARELACLGPNIGGQEHGKIVCRPRSCGRILLLLTGCLCVISPASGALQGQAGGEIKISGCNIEGCKTLHSTQAGGGVLGNIGLGKMTIRGGNGAISADSPTPKIVRRVSPCAFWGVGVGEEEGRGSMSQCLPFRRITQLYSHAKSPANLSKPLAPLLSPPLPIRPQLNSHPIIRVKSYGELSTVEYEELLDQLFDATKKNDLDKVV
jgi:hypothetical protein